MSKFRDFEKYEVYEDGRIYSYKRNKFLTPTTTKNGYQTVCLSDNECKQKWYKVHRVVWEAVTGKPIPSNMQINHINEDKTANFFANLELMTPKQNSNYGSRNTRIAKAKINGKTSKQVGAYRNGELIFTFPSAMEAGRNGFDQGAVSACCRCAKNYKTHKGFTWRYI